VRPIRELLQAFYASVCAQVQDVGRSVLVGNVSTWLQRMERILQWQQQLDHIQIRPVRVCWTRQRPGEDLRA